MRRLIDLRRLAGATLRSIKRPKHSLAVSEEGVETGKDEVSRARFRLSPTAANRYPDGWVRLTLRCATPSTVGGDLRLVCIYADGTSTFPLPTAQRNRVEAILHIRGDATRWEIHSTAASRQVAIEDVTIVELTESEAAVRNVFKLAANRNWKPGDALRLARKAVHVLRNEGIDSLFERLTGRDPSTTNAVTYARWIVANEPRTSAARVAIRERIEVMQSRPKFSIVMPVFNTPVEWLERAVASVREQLWQEWELCIADDASTSSATRAALERLSASDTRIHVVFRTKNGHISEASNSALSIATGDYIALLDHDDELAPHALFVMADYINRHPDAVLLYSDEDKIDEKGHRYDPYFKPDWDPELFASQNFVNHLGVYRRDALVRTGGFRTGFEGSQDYDLVLRVIEGLTAAQIVHVPHVLYHWRAIPGSTALDIDEKSYAVQRARQALKEHFERRNIDVSIEPAWDRSQFHRIRYALPTPVPSVSIIVCTRDRVDLLKTAVESVERLTDYPNYEIVVVDNQSAEAATKTYLTEISKRPRVRVLTYDEPFNFSAMNNFAARQSSADIYVLLNNDIEVISRDWLTELVSHAARPEIGCVGAMLYYPDERIQHAGVVLGINGVAGHAYRLLRRGGMGYFSRAAVVQSYSAVTAACLAIRRSVYWEVDGLDPRLAVAFNDVDFCIRVRNRGYRNVWTPYAELYHYESATRGSDMAPDKRVRFQREVELMIERWGSSLTNDPAHNPNLRLDDENFRLAEKSRAHRPWQFDD